MPDGQMACQNTAAQCDCRKVLDALTECRSLLAILAEGERLAVLCTLASEHGLSVNQRPPETHDGATHLHSPDGIEWAREFVSQVVLSDALVGAALRLDESKREIDDVAKRLERVAAESPAPRHPKGGHGSADNAAPGSWALGRDERPDALEQLIRDYRAAVSPPLEALCNHAQELLERAQTGSVDAEIALAIAEEAARLAEISIRFKQPPAQA